MTQIRPAQAMTQFASEMHNVNEDWHCHEENFSTSLIACLVWPNVLCGPVHNEEQPEELVEALAEDVLPHLGADEGFIPAVGLLQQQLRCRRLSGQGCKFIEL